MVTPGKTFGILNILTEIDDEGRDDGPDTGRHGATSHGHIPDDGGEDLRGNGIDHTKGGRYAELPQHFQ